MRLREARTCGMMGARDPLTRSTTAKMLVMRKGRSTEEERNGRIGVKRENPSFTGIYIYIFLLMTSINTTSK